MFALAVGGWLAGWLGGGRGGWVGPGWVGGCGKWGNTPPPHLHQVFTCAVRFRTYDAGNSSTSLTKSAARKRRRAVGTTRKCEVR